MPVLLLISGLVLLVAGGELLVRGAVRLAVTLGTPPLIIGLTVVAFGTSFPELAVSVFAALRGSADLAVGNVVGSNIFNVLFILGVSALLVPLVVSQQLIRIDVPIMIIVSIVLLIFALDGRLGVVESIALVSALAAYLALQIIITRHSQPADLPAVTASDEEGGWILHVALIVIGLALLFVGCRWFVDGAIFIARMLGVTELVIGLTIVAAGTSLPEVVTSVIAALRGQRDIAVGNVIGSNIFNILAVLGITGLISAGGGIPVSPAAVNVDIPVMLFVALICLPIFFSGYTISRWEGALFLAYFTGYIAYLVLDAAQHDGLHQYRRIILTVAVPLTAATLLISSLRSWHSQRR